MDIDERHPQLLAKDLEIERLQSEVTRLRNVIKEGYQTQARAYRDASEQAAAAQANRQIDLILDMMKDEDTICPHCGYEYDSDDMCEGSFWDSSVEEGTDECPDCGREFRWSKLQVTKISTYEIGEE